MLHDSILMVANSTLRESLLESCTLRCSFELLTNAEACSAHRCFWCKKAERIWITFPHIPPNSSTTSSIRLRISAVKNYYSTMRRAKKGKMTAELYKKKRSSNNDAFIGALASRQRAGWRREETHGWCTQKRTSKCAESGSDRKAILC